MVWAEWKKYFVAGWAFTECLLFAGLLYGWPSLNFVLKAEGIYSDLCEDTLNNSVSNNGSEVIIVGLSSATTSQLSTTTSTATPLSTSQLSTTTPTATPLSTSQLSTTTTLSVQSTKDEACKQQDSRMALCFTIGIIMFGIGYAIFGGINFKFKTRITRCISCTIFILGAFMMVLVGKEKPWLMFPGLILITVGGLPVFMTNIQVSNLFPTRSSTIVGLLCGAFDGSSAVMLLVKIAYENGFSRMYMFIIILLLHLILILVSTMVFLPADFIRQSSPEDVVEMENREIRETQADSSRVKYILKQGKFLLHVAWLSLLQLRFFYYIGTLDAYLNEIFSEDEEEEMINVIAVSCWINVCLYVMLLGIVTSPLSGRLYDHMKPKFQGGRSEKYRKVMPAVIPLFVGSGLSLLLSMLSFFPDKSALWLSFFVLTVHRSFLYSIGSGFISAMYPSEYFGILFGIMMFVGGIFNLLVYPLSNWSENSPEASTHVNIFLLIMVILSFIHPVYLCVRCRLAENTDQNQPEQQPMNPN